MYMRSHVNGWDTTYALNVCVCTCVLDVLLRALSRWRSVLVCVCVCARVCICACVCGVCVYVRVWFWQLCGWSSSHVQNLPGPIHRGRLGFQTAWSVLGPRIYSQRSLSSPSSRLHPQNPLSFGKRGQLALFSKEAPDSLWTPGQTLTFTTVQTIWSTHIWKKWWEVMSFERSLVQSRNWHKVINVWVCLEKSLEFIKCYNKC